MTQTYENGHKSVAAGHGRIGSAYCDEARSARVLRFLRDSVVNSRDDQTMKQAAIIQSVRQSAQTLFNIGPSSPIHHKRRVNAVDRQDAEA